MIRYCKHCGALIEDKSLEVCNNCGQPLTHTATNKRGKIASIISLILVIIISFGLVKVITTEQYHVQGFVIGVVDDGNKNTYLIDGFVNNNTTEEYLIVTTTDSYKVGDFISNDNFVYNDSFISIQGDDGSMTTYKYYTQSFY